jgi:predicted transcriptional regulator
MGAAESELPALSEAQREIMEIVWERGEISARDVRLVLAKRRDIARNTVRTMLERMEEKGWLRHCVESRTYLYSAAQPREATVGQKVVEVLDQVCGGSPEALMTALLDYRGLSTSELKRIRQMLDTARGTAKPSKKKRR